MNAKPRSKKIKTIIVIEIFVFVALAIGLSTIILSNQFNEAIAEAKQIVGTVQKMDMEDGQISQITLDQSVGINQRVISESNSYAVFELLDGEAILEIEPFTSVVLNVDNTAKEPILIISLEVGHIRVSGGQGRISVHTPTGTATPASVDGAMSIEVQLNSQSTEYTGLQGFYQVTNQSGTSEIKAGQSVNYGNINLAQYSDSDKSLNQLINETTELNIDEKELLNLVEQPTQEIQNTPEVTSPAIVEQPEEAVPTAVQATSLPTLESPTQEITPTEEPQLPTATQPTVEEPTATQPTTTTDDNQNNESVETEPVIVPGARAVSIDISSITWKMTQFGDPSSLYSVPEGLNSSLKYDDDADIISGTMGCNSFRGEAEFLDNSITVTKLPSAISKNACIEPIMNYESLFHTMIGLMVSYEITDATLIITTSLDWVMIFEEMESTVNSSNTRTSVNSTPPQLPTQQPTQPPSTNTYYVNSSIGEDSNPGTQDAPWRTIQFAADALPEGKTVIVTEGQYPERVTISRPNLTFKTEGEVKMEGFSIQADYTTISGFSITSLVDDVPQGIGIDVPNAGHCLITNNRFLYNTWGGLRLDAASHDCIVRNNTFFRNALYAAEVMGQNHLIENNDVSHSIQYHPCSSSTASWLDADAFRFHGSGHIFRGNNIHDMSFGGAGYDQGAGCSLENLSDLSMDFVDDSHTDCFQTFGGERIAGHDILFEGNHCELPSADQWPGNDAAGKAFQATGNAYNLTFRNNLVIADFLSFFADGCHDFNIYHNTFIGSGDTYSQGFQFENCSGNIQVKNNIFVNQANGIGHIWQVNAPVDAGNNCVYLEGSDPKRSADPGDIWGMDPLLDGNFRLTENSPCIDAGIDFGISIDFDSRSRPQGEGPDIGAFEYPAP